LTPSDTESAAVDFKTSFDPESKQDWCELIKDIISMTNSGGGCIVIGVADDGSLSGADIQPLLAVDPADVTNRIHSYTDQHFSAFEIVQGVRSGSSVAVVSVGPQSMSVTLDRREFFAIAALDELPSLTINAKEIQ
jgi:predicted HTH transcriptional regulator